MSRLLWLLLAGCDLAPPSTPPQTAPAQQVCAWLVNGDTHSHHTGNINNAAAALRSLGVPAVNIFAATEEPRPYLHVHRANLQRADLQGLLLQRSQLQSCLGRANTLVLYLTGHGRPADAADPGNTSIVLHRSADLRAEALLEWIEETMPVSRLVLVTDICFGGGFVQTFQQRSGTYTGMSATDDQHTTFCQPFSPLFWNTWAGTTSLEQSFREAISGCQTYRVRGTCAHGANACPTYQQRAMLLSRP